MRHAFQLPVAPDIHTEKLDHIHPLMWPHGKSAVCIPIVSFLLALAPKPAKLALQPILSRLVLNPCNHHQNNRGEFMNEPIVPDIKHKDWRDRLLDAWQMIFVGFSALIMLMFLSGFTKLDAPGAPVMSFWITAALGGLILIAHWPTIFERLSIRWRVAPYAAWVGFFFLMTATFEKVGAAWDKTPEGVAEAKQNDVAAEERWRTREVEAERQREEAALRATENQEEQAQKQADNLEDCFTSFGHRLPSLEDPFKEALHNPDAYEHVETMAIDPNFEGHNVVMKFRGENGMGAIRLGSVTAKVDPENCEVVAMGDPELM